MKIMEKRTNKTESNLFSIDKKQAFLYLYIQPYPVVIVITFAF